MSWRLPIASKANGPMVSRAERGCLSLSDRMPAAIAAKLAPHGQMRVFDYNGTYTAKPAKMQPPNLR